MKLFKSKAGFTLIELLVVIGILAVLAAIAIPSVAGLIDRANASADKTNSNEMTNALERFTSEYELYCQDIASGALDPDNLDSAQGRVKNVIGVTTRSGIEGIEFAQNATVADDVIAIYRDTKYPMNAYTMQKVVENYTKTSSSTFEPKQSDMHYWYSPDCGVVVVAEPTKTATELDKYVISGMDAKGNDITSDSVNAQWIDITLSQKAVSISGILWDKHYVCTVGDIMPEFTNYSALKFNSNKTLSLDAKIVPSDGSEAYIAIYDQIIPTSQLQYNENYTECIFSDSKFVVSSDRKTIYQYSLSTNNLMCTYVIEE